MVIINIILFLMFWGIIIFSFSKSKNPNDNNIIKKVIMNIPTFIVLFVMYYFVICIISMIPLAMMQNNSKSDSGLWAYSIMLGMGLAPVLSIITIIRLNKKNVKMLEEVDNDMIRQKKKSPTVIISIVIFAIICMGLILLTNLNCNTLSKELVCSDINCSPKTEKEIF